MSAQTAETVRGRLADVSEENVNLKARCALLETDLLRLRGLLNDIWAVAVNADSTKGSRLGQIAYLLETQFGGPGYCVHGEMYDPDDPCPDAHNDGEVR